MGVKGSRTIKQVGFLSSTPLSRSAAAPDPKPTLQSSCGATFMHLRDGGGEGSRQVPLESS